MLLRARKMVQGTGFYREYRDTYFSLASWARASRSTGMTALSTYDLTDNGSNGTLWLSYISKIMRISSNILVYIIQKITSRINYAVVLCCNNLTLEYFLVLVIANSI